MTVIAACIRNGQAAIGADTASFVDGRIFHDGCKIFSIGAGRDKLLLGFAGQAALGRLVRRHLKVDAAPGIGEPIRPWLAAIAEAICEIAMAANPAPTNDDGYLDGHALALFRGELWMLSQQVAGQLRDGYGAIGAGGDLAQGALAALADSDLSATDQVVAAIQIAERHCDSVRCDVHGPQLHISHLDA